MRLGHHKLDVAALREVMEDPRVWCSLGVVYQDGDAYYEIDDEDVMVCVQLQPRGQIKWCWLAGVAGGPGSGLWKIPPVGSVVSVVMMGGEMDGDAVVTGVLSSAQPPSGLDADKMVMINPKDIVIKSQNGSMSFDADGKVHIQNGKGNAQPIGRKGDPVDMGSWGIIGTGIVITVVPPGGGATITIASSGPSPLTGQIKDGSPNADCG